MDHDVGLSRLAVQSKCTVSGHRQFSFFCKESGHTNGKCQHGTRLMEA